MPRKSDPLTALKVKSAKPGSYTDGGGLMLVVGKSSASWMLRYRFDGKRRDMGLGPARGEAALSLSVVRLRAAEARAQLSVKVDPLAAKEAEAAERQAAEARKVKAALDSFRAAAEALHQAKAGEWKNPKHAAQWLATLKAHVFPTIGAMPVAKVDTDDVLRVLQPIWAKTPETASRVRQRIEAVLSYGDRAPAPAAPAAPGGSCRGACRCGPRRMLTPFPALAALHPSNAFAQLHPIPQPTRRPE